MALEGRVTIEKLGTANYGTWKRRIRSLLESKGQWGYVTGEEDDKAKSVEVKGTILLYVDDYHLQMADGIITAKGLRDKLEKTFQAGTHAKRLLLRQQLNNLRKEPKEDVTQYIARAKEIASDPDSIGLQTEFAELVLPIMAGLPKGVQYVSHHCGSLQDRVHLSRGSCHVMVVSDRYRAQTSYSTSRIHSFSTVWSSGSNVTIGFGAPGLFKSSL